MCIDFFLERIGRLIFPRWLLVTLLPIHNKLFLQHWKTVYLLFYNWVNLDIQNLDMNYNSSLIQTTYRFCSSLLCTENQLQSSTFSPTCNSPAVESSHWCKASWHSTDTNVQNRFRNKPRVGLSFAPVWPTPRSLTLLRRSGSTSTT